MNDIKVKRISGFTEGIATLHCQSTKGGISASKSIYQSDNVGVNIVLSRRYRHWPDDATGASL
jgi:hypothetical protein